MRFDWYQASVPNVDPMTVMEALSKTEYYGDWEQVRPLKGYDAGAQFVLGTQVMYRISHGGQNAQYGANVLATGSNAQRLADVVREHFPAHRVSRVDACEDFVDEAAYDYLRGEALRIAKARKLHVHEIVKPLEESDDGRTLYLGSKESAVSGRIYEKGKQLNLDQPLVRAELQVRPQKHVKDMAARLSASEMWGLARWSLDVGRMLGEKDLKKVDVQLYQPSDHDRAYRSMLKQYGKMLNRMLAIHGSPEAVGGQIFYDLENLEEQEEKRRQGAIR